MKRFYCRLILISGLLLSFLPYPAKATTDALASSVLKACQRQNAKSIACTKIYHNGGISDEFSSSLMDSVMSGLISNNKSLTVIDASTAKLLAAEDGLFLSTSSGTRQSADVLLVGEVFTLPSCSEAACSLRLISMKTGQILASNVVRFKHPVKQPLSSQSIPSLSSFETMDISRLITKRWAMSDAGNVSADNTFEIRLARAEIISYLVNSNISLYEREFLFLLAQESTAGNKTIFDTLVKSDGMISVTSKMGKIDVSAVNRETQGLVMKSSLKFTASVGGGSVGELSDDALNDFLKKREQSMAVQKNELSFSHEILITDKNVLQKEEIQNFRGRRAVVENPYMLQLSDDWNTNGYKFGKGNYAGNSSMHFLTFAGCDNVNTRSYSAFMPDPQVPYNYNARELLIKWLNRIAAGSNNNKEVIKAFMIVGTLVGFHTTNDNEGQNGSSFVGPFWLCSDKIIQTITTDPAGKMWGTSPYVFPLQQFPRQLLSYLLYDECERGATISGFPKGTYKWITHSQNGSITDYKVDYEVQIEWKESVPASAKITFDFSPMKDKLFRVTQLQRDD